MQPSSSRRAVARRALGARARLLIADGDPELVDTAETGWVRHAVAAAIIALLGLVVAGSFLLTTSTDHTEASANPRMVANAPDITRAAPAGAQRGVDTSTGSSVEHDADTATGDLDVYDHREQASSRQAVRDQLARVAAAKQARARARGLTTSSESAREEAAEQARTKRTTEVVEGAEAARVEQERLLEEKRKAEEAARLAKLAAEKAKAEMAKTAGTATTTGVTGASAATTGARIPQIDVGSIPTGTAVSPLAPGSYRLSARWGAYGSWSRWHTGMDLSAPIGTPIRAAVPGVVVTDRANGWAGVHVSIRHADGSATLYAHMSARTVAPGTLVGAGTVIGYVGMTGRTFGPHLHFEYYPPGTSPGDVYSARDPWAWMYSKGVHL